MASENRRWNRLADRMAYFHTALATKFDNIYAVDLDAHHSIEEVYVFPVLAQKMPNFADNERHKNSHKVIHSGAIGLDKLKDLVAGWKAEPTTFSPGTLRSCLDEFKTPLFKHLSEEVRDLSGENLKKYYTLEEVDRLPIHFFLREQVPALGHLAHPFWD
ncbi:hypothetical protein AG1IA_03248 [Rhizoctonia solani AG-1 IA]|uniref:Hemerythrin-like domain-containing protein n=1 Tax=Thanatephorus cucumeris (strain AG1-IA) TaxID=983506 RepID=L8X117_THACA|nr:hypothetical protein AG1IA_03248 [Rhizoctonia solani AG-1 IA]